MQFAVSSWVTLLAIFAGGIAAAQLTYGRSKA